MSSQDAADVEFDIVLDDASITTAAPLPTCLVKQYRQAVVAL
jgi:hypothetical protein